MAGDFPKAGKPDRSLCRRYNMAAVERQAAENGKNRRALSIIPRAVTVCVRPKTAGMPPMRGENFGQWPSVERKAYFQQKELQNAINNSEITAKMLQKTLLRCDPDTAVEIYIDLPSPAEIVAGRALPERVPVGYYAVSEATVSAEGALLLTAGHPMPW